LEEEEEEEDVMEVEATTTTPAAAASAEEEKRKRARSGKKSKEGRPECTHHSVRNYPVLKHFQSFIFFLFFWMLSSFLSLFLTVMEGREGDPPISSRQILEIVF